MDQRTSTGLSLIEILIACLLSVLLIRALSTLIVTIAQHTTSQQQHILLLQHSWLVERITLNALENAGYSAAFSSDAASWQSLSNHDALRLYQFGSEPLPAILQSHWAKKILTSSTILESVSLDQTQFIHQQSIHSISVNNQPLAHTGDQWLITCPDAWQLIQVAKVEHHPYEQYLHFSTPLNPELQPPLIAGLYRHQLWFVALDGHYNSRHEAQYGLYQWNINQDISPQEIVSGLATWQGHIVDHTKTANDVNTLIEWHFTLREGSHSLSQMLYAINNNLQ